MKRFATALLFSVLAVALHPPAAGAQSLLFDYLGFDYYSTPGGSPTTALDPTHRYTGLGTVPGVFAPLVADTSTKEYTYVMSGLIPTSITPVGGFFIINYGPGTVSLYEDSKTSGTTADYGTNPPNAVAPPTFTDGTLFLKGTLTNFQFVLDPTGGGSFEAQFDVTGGSHFSDVPSNQRRGWTFSGATRNALNIPLGYAHQIDGQTFLDAPVATRHVTWGRLKATYR